MQDDFIYQDEKPKKEEKKSINLDITPEQAKQQEEEVYFRSDVGLRMLHLLKTMKKEAQANFKSDEEYQTLFFTGMIDKFIRLVAKKYN